MSGLSQDPFFSRLFQTGMDDSSSGFYLPKLLLSSDDPELDPYTVAKLALGTISVKGPPEVSLDVTLTDFSLAGLSNARLPADGVTLTDLNVVFQVDFSQITPPPSGSSAEIEVQTGFSATNEEAGTLTGNLTLAIKSSSLKGAFAIGGNDLTVMTVRFRHLTLEIPPTEGNVNACVKIDNGGTFWDTYLATAMEKASVLNTITKTLNEYLEGDLDKIGDGISGAIQKVVKQKLGSA